MTVEEILAELGVEVDPAKTESLKSWNGKLKALESDGQQKFADAQKQLEDAQALQRVINDTILTSGLTEANVAQLQANNAALKSALEARDAAIAQIKQAGFSGLEVPELPPVNTTNAPEKDPVKELQENIMRGIGVMGETMNEMNRYQRIFGAAVPEDPATIADRATKSRMSVRDYMEQTYKMSEREKANAKAAEDKKIADMKTKWEEEYKAAHPITTGHPELGSGVPSNYPNIPKPSNSQGVREMAGKSPMEKIRMARDRVSKEVQTRMNAA